MAEVILDHITKKFDDGTIAVDDVSFTVRDKEFTVLVGPSGCGKSTTLRMIAGLEEISSGTIFIDGKQMNKVEPKDRDIAMVFQNYALYPHMTVYDNMAFGLKLRKFKKNEIRERVLEAAAILGLENLLERKPRALSGGQRQRVAVGRAIVRKPKVFLFDEPLSNLDAKLRVQMRTEIINLHRKLDATMIYVTHDQVEAMTMGTSIVVMDRGIVQQMERPMELYKNPVNKFVAGFIGSPAMNFIRGTVNGKAFSESGVSLPLVNALNSMVEKDDNEVWLGIRPEHFSRERLTPEDIEIEVKIDMVEPLGGETLYYFRFAGSPVIAKIPSDDIPNPGDERSLFIHPGRFYFFSADDGLRLT